ncbi:MAG: 50S ribosomal protein L23 [Candidatus Paceibacterota bacterium]
MALFSRKKAPAKKSAEKAPATAAPARPAVAAVADRNLSSVIVKPRITEKAMQKSEQNVYTFIVRRDATKHDVAEAITALYNVTPVKVNIVNKAPRQYISRRLGRTVSEKGMKKAYVYLKKGDSISLM